MLIDSHCHLDDIKFDVDREDVIKSFNENDIEFVVNASADFLTSQKALELAQKYSNVYCSLGQHPEGAENFNETFEGFIKENAQNPKVVAIGEIGLDYYYLVTPKEIQKEVFIKQIKLAHELNLPIMLHVRDAWGDAIEILRENKKQITLGGVVHCFSGSTEIAKELINMGFYLGFDGPITYKNAGKLLDVVKFVPLNKMLIETDCPYLAPQEVRGMRNEPKYVKFIAQKICEIKNIKICELETTLKQNIKNVYTKIKV